MKEGTLFGFPTEIDVKLLVLTTSGGLVLSPIYMTLEVPNREEIPPQSPLYSD